MFATHPPAKVTFEKDAKLWDLLKSGAHSLWGKGIFDFHQSSDFREGPPFHSTQ